MPRAIEMLGEKNKEELPSKEPGNETQTILYFQFIYMHW